MKCHGGRSGARVKGHAMPETRARVWLLAAVGVGGAGGSAGRGGRFGRVAGMFMSSLDRLLTEPC